jgi:hypothetical protein
VCCGNNAKKYIERKGETIYICKKWKDYVDTVRFANIFSISSFVNNRESLQHILLLCPVINIGIGALKVVIGLITLPFTFLITCIIKTESFSWLEWSCIHVFHGVLGITVIGYPIYACTNKDDQIKSIRHRVFTSKGWVNNFNDLYRDSIIESYNWEIRTIDEFYCFVKELLIELNPYSMNYLYEIDGKMNIMDKMATLPLIGLIPFVLRTPAIFAWLTFGWCHTIWMNRVDRPSYFKILGYYVFTGLLAGSFVLTWVNCVIYICRLELIPKNTRRPKK